MTKIRTSNLVVNTALTDSTDTNLSGLLKGGTGKVAVATPDTDYATPTSVGQKVSKASNLSDLANRQTALNNLGGAGAGNESKVLAQDPADGNIKLMAAASGGTGGGLTYDFVLNENITAGNIVQLLSTGKIEKITSSVIAEALPTGNTNYTFKNTAPSYLSIAYDPFNADKFVVIWRDGADGYGKAVIGTISGTVVSFGAIYVFLSSSAATMSVAFDLFTQNRFVISYNHTSNWYVCGGTVSGTVLTFGANSLLQSGAVENSSIVADPFANGVFYTACRRTSDGYGLFTRVTLGAGTTVSGTLSGFFYTGNTNFPSVVADSKVQNRILISYCDQGYGNYPFVVAATNGTSITFGTRLQVEALGVSNTQLCQVNKSDNTFVVSYTDGSYSLIKASVLTVAGTVITAGAIQSIFSGTNQFMVMKSDKNTEGKILFVFYDGVGGAKGAALVGTVSGNTITTGTKSVFRNTASVYYLACAFDIQGNNPGKFIIVYYDYSAGYYNSVAMVGQVAAIITNLSSTKLVGVLKETGTTNQTKPVTVMGGIDASRSGLTPNSLYFIQPDGSVSTSNPAGSVLLGRAISTTAILTKQNF